MAALTMGWSRTLTALQRVERLAVQAARDAHDNLRYSPDSILVEEVARLDAAATKAQDAVTAHFKIR